MVIIGTKPGNDRKRHIKKAAREEVGLAVGQANVEEPSGHLVGDTGKQSNRRGWAAGPNESCLSHDMNVIGREKGKARREP